MYHSSSWHSEPYHQNQNPSEWCYRTIKAWTNTILNRSGAPANCRLLCMSDVCCLLNHIYCDGSKSFLFGDNRSMVTSTTLPHSTLTKCHSILAFHKVREAIAAKLMAFYWIYSAYNSSDMFSKHWDNSTVYPVILKVLITRGNITLIPREAKQEKEKKILKSIQKK